MILVVDFGSQYTQLIARRVREAKVYCQIQSFDGALAAAETLKPRGVILSGGPASVYDTQAPSIDRRLLELDFKLPFGLDILLVPFSTHHSPVQHPSNIIMPFSRFDNRHRYYLPGLLSR